MKSKIPSLFLSFCILCYYIDKVDCVLRCKCTKDYCPDNHRNYTCTTKGICFRQLKIDEHTGKKKFVMGCLAHEPSGNTSIFQCKHGVRRLEETNSVLCCHEYDFCNSKLLPTLRPTRKKTRGTILSKTKIGTTVIALAVSSIICFLIFVIFISVYCCRQKHQGNYRQFPIKNHIVSNPQTIQQLLEENANTAGSGSGLPYLVQRTIARQVHKTRKIGTGRFSCVYEAQWRGDKVAIRIFQSRDEVLWLRECSFYTDLPRHDNILAFIASDRRGDSSATELYMITEFCPHGSLNEYLKSHYLSKKEMLQLTTSVACGLAYLHKEITGTRGKLSIAHRNLTSRGIYVKKGGVCAIGDFALALKSDCDLSEKEMEKNPRQVSRLYMAPELLHKTSVVVKGNFALLMMSDIYSLALILWEIVYRTVSEGIQEPYQAPYHDMVGSNPSIDELRKVVFVESKRPPILNRWHDDHEMREISNVIEECWHHSPNARLTALRVQKNLMSIKDPLDDTVQIV